MNDREIREGERRQREGEEKDCGWEAAKADGTAMRERESTGREGVKGAGRERGQPDAGRGPADPPRLG